DRAFPGSLPIAWSKKIIGHEIVDGNRDHQPFDSGDVAALAQARSLQNKVCQERLLGVSTCAEQRAGTRESVRDLGDDSRGPENRELRAERGEEVTTVTLPQMIWMDGDLVDEGRRRPLRADQDADRIGSRESDHAAAAPDLKVADR